MTAPESRAADLAPCPFCGGAANFQRMGTYLQSCIVTCNDCGATVESGEEGAFCGKAWNRRAPDTTSAAAEAAMREALEAVDAEYVLSGHVQEIVSAALSTPASAQAERMMRVMQHDWIPSTLGHGETMCSRCKITNREADALGEHECAPPTPKPANDIHLTQEQIDDSCIAVDDEDYDPGEECGRWENGWLSRYCSRAGTEFCDWDCPYSR